MQTLQLSSTTRAKIPKLIFKLCSMLNAATGGKSFLVGGAVVDLLQLKTPKDWDIEVYGASYEQIVNICQEYKPKTVGKAFGIVKLSATLCDDLDIDINVPRRENAYGTRHKDFDCELDPSMTPKEAAMRRDFTINSMYLDPLTMQVTDHFGGVHHLYNGVLCATNHTTFKQDPLRPLRAMQLIARKATTIDPTTMHTIKSMVDTFDSLSKERIYEEYKKLILLGTEPSRGLRFLLESGYIKHFPELQALVNCGQHPDWHPEGDVFEHTCHVVDSVAYARDHVPSDWREAFAFGAMLHDVGKPTTTVTPQMIKEEHPMVKKLVQKLNKTPQELLWTSIGHDQAGIEPATAFLTRLTDNKKLIEKASAIVGQHMQPYNLMQGGAGTSAYRRLHNKLRLDILGWMSKCDCCGRETRHIEKGWPYGDPDLEHDVSEQCFAYFGEFGKEPIQKIIQGRDLIAEGVKPGPHMGTAVKAAYEAQLNGLSNKDDLLKVALQAIVQP